MAGPPGGSFQWPIWIGCLCAASKQRDNTMLCILGPTASGKSGLAMAIATENPRVEIISMDSALVYKGMDIGTAKPTEEERAQVPHHLIDLIDPSESYSAAQFVRDAAQAAREIRARGNVPLMVGGTMLYYKAYAQGLDDLPSVPLSIRQAIASQAKEVGWPALHAQLSTIDPETAARLAPNDAQRISRALELVHYTGKTMSALIAQSAQQRLNEEGFYPDREPLAVIALEPHDRARLHARIADRFHAMLQAGFVEEVRALKERGDLTSEMPSMRCVGYRQAWDYLEGKTSYDNFVNAGIAATRQLAKRQITWIRSFHDVEKHDPFTEDGLLRPCLAMTR
jgi:tRNA dimethylallyltransferase